MKILNVRYNIKYIIFFVALILCAVLGGIVFRERSLSWLMLSAAVLGCAAVFAAFEKKELSHGEIPCTAVMTALSVFGRIAFAAVPGVKPCSAVIIISGIFLGSRQGFMVGALTALISNLYFGQGIWTPFQMIIWGLTGFFAGLLWKPLMRSRTALCIFGVLCGGAFSLFMDLWSCIWTDNAFILSRYLAMTAASGWFTLCYAVSNAVFLMLFIKPSERIFRRLNKKFAIGRKNSEDLFGEEM